MSDERAPRVRRVGRRRVVSEPPRGAAGAPVEPVWSPSSDDVEPPGAADDDAGHDAWLRRQRPPHWG